MEREARIVSVFDDDELLNAYIFGQQLYRAELLEDLQQDSL